MLEMGRTLVVTEQDFLKVKYVVSKEFSVGSLDSPHPPLLQRAVALIKFTIASSQMQRELCGCLGEFNLDPISTEG